MRTRAVWLVAGVLALAGCSGSEEPAISPTTVEATVEPSTPPPPEPTGGGTASTQVDVEVTACQAAVEAAARAGAEGQASDVWPAFAACSSVAEFTAAVEAAGGARFDGTDPEAFIQEQCDSQPAVARTPLCSGS